MLSKILNNLLRPNYAIGYFLGNSFPNYFRNRYVTKTKKFGINKKYFIMSFDCDTDKDIEVVREVDSKLRKLGISATYAVPGELLKRGKDEYTSIKLLGSEFINHGYLSHTEFDEKNKNMLVHFFMTGFQEKRLGMMFLTVIITLLIFLERSQLDSGRRILAPFKKLVN